MLLSLCSFACVNAISQNIVGLGSPLNLLVKQLGTRHVSIAVRDRLIEDDTSVF